MHIIITRLSSMGDVILQTPLISWLKYSVPELKITFVTFEEFSCLIKDHPHIDQVIGLKRLKGLKDLRNIHELCRGLAEQDIDCVIDLHNTLRAKLIRFFLFRTPNIIVNKRSFLRFLLVKFKINLLKNLESHHTRLIKDFGFIFESELGIESLQTKLQHEAGIQGLGVSSSAVSFMNDLEKSSQKYLVISPVASFVSKRWPISRYEDLIVKILAEKSFSEYDIYIVAGPNDKYVDEGISQEVLTNPRVTNLRGQLSLLESLKVIAKAQACITNDTGSLHMAESCGVPVIAIFGSTSESFGFRPHLKNSDVISSSVWCRPCSATGSKKCFRSKHYCMLGISANDVFNKVKLVLDKRLAV